MPNKERIGNRKKRTCNHRIPELGRYLIFTDTEKTEVNYFYGLRDSLTEDCKNKIVIKVIKADTSDLVTTAKNMMALHSQYAKPWIVFDRDKVKDFDKIINEAEQYGISVGWSNPCIEVWFCAYFDQMVTNSDSVNCCKAFKAIFKKATGKAYKKSSKDIYAILKKFGDEESAISIARTRIKCLENGCNNRLLPSEMCPATKVHILVGEIREQTKIQND